MNYYICPGLMLWRFPTKNKTLEKIKKNEVFDDRGPAEKCCFGTFHKCFIKFQVSWCHIMMISCHKRAFERIKKSKFSMAADLKKNVVLGLLQFCWLSSQMNELLQFRCPGVISWLFLAIKRAFEKIKNEVFNYRGPAEKMLFWDFSQFLQPNKWMITF